MLLQLFTVWTKTGDNLNGFGELIIHLNKLLYSKLTILVMKSAVSLLSEVNTNPVLKLWGRKDSRAVAVIYNLKLLYLDLSLKLFETFETLV